MTKKSNIKRMGIKSIHYNENNVIIEDALSAGKDLLFNVEFNDIATLDKEIRRDEKNPRKNTVQFSKDKDTQGFSLEKTIKNDNLTSNICRVKTKSFVQGIFNINDTNNIEIQIFQNCEDIKKILIRYINSVFYSINSVISLDLEEFDNEFDLIGTFPSEQNFKDYRDYKNHNYIFKKDILPKLRTLLKNYGLEYSIINQSNIQNRSQKSSQDTTDAQKIYDEKLDKLAFNYLRMLSLIRNLIVHPERKYDNSKFQDLYNIAKKDVEQYKSNFIKNNLKYISIFNSFYSHHFKPQDFFNFMIFGETKNIGISIEKIRKNVVDSMQLVEKVESRDSNILKRDRAEFLNKFKVCLGYDIYRYFKKNNLIEKNIIKLRESTTDEEKDSIYESLAKTYKNNNVVNIDKLQNIVKNNLGKQRYGDKYRNITINIDFNRLLSNNFFNLLYVFSTFLTKKDINSMYSDLITKVESINDLLKMAQSLNIKISQSIVNRFYFIFNLGCDLDSEIKQLNLLKNLCMGQGSKIKQALKTTIQYRKIVNCFDSSNYESLNRDLEIKRIRNGEEIDEKPLKQFLRNNVYLSKDYTYLKNYTDTRICNKIIKQKQVVLSVLLNMLGKNLNDNTEGEFNVEEDCVSMYKYLSSIYHDFKHDNINEYGEHYFITKSQLLELVNELSNLNFFKIRQSIFNTIYNYHNYTVLVKLYLNVCYIVVKKIMNINSSYFVAFEDFDFIKNQLKNKGINNENYLSVVDYYIAHSNKKHSRSYKQLLVLNKKDYILLAKNNLSAYNFLIRKYRNIILHGTILQDLSLWDKNIEYPTSYFALFQTLVQRCLHREINSVWENSSQYFSHNNKNYSTKLVIALNFPFAYNISRFNNITIEKYAIKKI